MAMAIADNLLDVSDDKFEQILRDVEENASSESLLSILLTDGTFKMHFKKKKVPFETICRMLKILATVCECPTDEQRPELNRFIIQHLPQSLNEHHFLTHELLMFVSQMDRYATPDKKDICIKTTGNLLVFLQFLQETFPSASLDVIKMILPLLVLKIHTINKKTNVIARNDVDRLTEIQTAFQNALFAIAPRESGGDEIRPPNDFRTINIPPSTEEMLAVERPFLRPNIVAGEYSGGIEQYLDIQFRLLREDFVRPLREGIQELTQQLGNVEDEVNEAIDKVKDIHVYRNIQILGCQMRRRATIFTAAFDTRLLPNVEWKVRLI